MHHIALFIRDGVAKHLAFGGVGGKYLHLYLGIVTVNGRCHLNARCAIVIHIKVRCGQSYDANITVKATIESKVCYLRINSIIYTIIYGDGEVVLVLNMVGEVYTPGRVTTVMMCKMLTIEIDVS